MSAGETVRKARESIVAKYHSFFCFQFANMLTSRIEVSHISPSDFNIPLHGLCNAPRTLAFCRVGPLASRHSVVRLHVPDDLNDWLDRAPQKSWRTILGTMPQYLRDVRR